MKKLLAGIALMAVAGAVAIAQSMTAADYARDERFITYNTTPLVLHHVTRATRIADAGVERVWYRTTTEKGSEAFLIDPLAATRSACDLPACREAARQGDEQGPPAARTEARSPDGKSAARSEEHTSELQ